MLSCETQIGLEGANLPFFRGLLGSFLPQLLPICVWQLELLTVLAVLLYFGINLGDERTGARHLLVRDSLSRLVTYCFLLVRYCFSNWLLLHFILFLFVLLLFIGMLVLQLSLLVYLHWLLLIGELHFTVSERLLLCFLLSLEKLHHLWNIEFWFLCYWLFCRLLFRFSLLWLLNWSRRFFFAELNWWFSRAFLRFRLARGKRIAKM